LAFQDQNLTCRDCGNQFTWTASEQEFYQSKGFQNAPVRCPSCRQAKKARMDGGRGGDRGGQRQMYEITCSNCGRKDTVPFQPRGDRPVLCGDCFRKQREGGLAAGPREDRNEAPREEAAPVEEAPAEEAPAAEEQNVEEEQPQS
jgi:CxxC-x17-CxxC domain-containing protein